MSRDPRYQRLLNSPRWREVKTQVWRRANGLCERCIREGKAAGVPDGYITPGVDCHHIRPVESGRTVMEMEQLCYNPANIELLCVPCHIKTHAEQRSHCREKVKENKARARQRFMEMNDPNYQPPEQPKPYGQQADEYLKNLEEQARLENLADRLKPRAIRFLYKRLDSQIHLPNLPLAQEILKILFFPHRNIPSQVCRFALYNPTAT